MIAAIVMAILMTAFTANTYAQYGGECWAADYYNVYKIASNGQATPIQGFSQPLSLSINPTDGSIWVADTDAIRVRKFSAAGQELAVLDQAVFTTNLPNPTSVSVDPRDGSCWVATGDTIYKFSSDAKQLAKFESFSEPSVAVNPANGECWIADSNKLRVLKFSADGKQLSETQTSGKPNFLSVNPADGGCWVLDTDNHKALKFSADGKIALETPLTPADVTPMASTCISASADGGCWAGVMVDMMNDWVIKFSADGKQVLKAEGFSMPAGLAADPGDGGCWVTNTDMMNPAGGSIIKLSANGQRIITIPGLYQPKVVTIRPVK